MQGEFQLGFELQPLDSVGGLASIDPGATFEENIVWLKAKKNKVDGNKAFKDGILTEAIARYTELIMQARSLTESGVADTDERIHEVRLLMAQAYLNLSACFLKMGDSLGHAQNTATRALQGDEDPPNPKHDVLPDASKAKAYFRRGQARQELQNYDLAKADYEASLKLAEDKATRQALADLKNKIKEAKQAEKEKLGGLFSKGDAFGPTRPPAVEEKKVRTEPVKISDGLFLAPDAPAEEKAVELEPGVAEGLEEEATRLKARVDAAAAHAGITSEEFIASLKADEKKAEAFGRGDYDPPEACAAA